MMLKVDFIDILPKSIFPYQISFIKFILPNVFLPKSIFTIGLQYVYLRLIFLGLG